MIQLFDIKKKVKQMKNTDKELLEKYTETSKKSKEEILKPHEKVKQLTGKEMILFRPPYGDYNDNLIQVCREIKYYPIQWDVDTLVM